MLSASEGMSAFSNVGIGYLEIAFEEPNLFRYLYMSGESGYHTGGFDILTTAETNSTIVAQIAKQLKLPIDKVNVLFRDSIIYAWTGLLYCVRLNQSDQSRSLCNGSESYEFIL